METEVNSCPTLGFNFTKLFFLIHNNDNIQILHKACCGSQSSMVARMYTQCLPTTQAVMVFKKNQ